MGEQVAAAAPVAGAGATAPGGLNEAQATQVGFKIEGRESPYLDLLLPPGGAFIAEPGAMLDIEEGISIGTVLGDGSDQRGFFGRLWNALKRPFSGESLFSVVYENNTEKTLRISFAAPYPGTITAVDLKQFGGEIICQRGAFLCGMQGVKIGIALQKRLRVGFFGGEGFMMQRLEGDSLVFIHTGGALVERKLAPGQTLRVDSGCLAALQPSVSYDIKYAGKVKTALFSGEGLFFANVTGPGSVWLQSMPIGRFAQSIVANANLSGAGQRSGVLGKLYLLLIVAVFFWALFADLEA